MTNGKFLLAENIGVIALNGDVGKSWSPVNDLTDSWRHGASNGDLHVLVAPSTWGVSTDGLNWQTGKFTSPFIPYGTAYGDGRFVVTGTNRAVYVCEDGETWTAASVPEG